MLSTFQISGEITHLHQSCLQEQTSRMRFHPKSESKLTYEQKSIVFGVLRRHLLLGSAVNKSIERALGSRHRHICFVNAMASGKGQHLVMKELPHLGGAHQAEHWNEPHPSSQASLYILFPAPADLQDVTEYQDRDISPTWLLSNMAPVNLACSMRLSVAEPTVATRCNKMPPSVNSWARTAKL